METYTLDEIRKLAGSKDIYVTKAGYLYKKVNGRKEYIKVKEGKR